MLRGAFAITVPHGRAAELFQAGGVFRDGIRILGHVGGARQKHGVCGVLDVQGREQVARPRDRDALVAATPPAGAELILRQPVQLDGRLALPLEVGVPAVAVARLQEPEARHDDEGHNDDERAEGVRKGQAEDAERGMARAPDLLVVAQIPFAFALGREGVWPVGGVGVSLSCVDK